MIHYLSFTDRHFNKVTIAIGGSHVPARDNGTLNALPEPEVWNHLDLTSVYHACEIFHIRVVKFAKARCMLMNVDNSCHVLSAYTSMTYARGKQNSSINPSQGHFHLYCSKDNK